MTLQFHSVISDQKYNFIDEEVRPIFKQKIENAGRKNIVFVEGYDDKVIYDMLYEEHINELYFMDISFTAEKSNIKCMRGCEYVKQSLKDFVQYLPQEKRFYGVIDRDLKMDLDIKTEKQQACYDARLFIFLERYTLENYFIEADILYEFLKGQSMNHKKLISLLKKNKDYFKTEILDPILNHLIKIGSANLTIRCLDDEQCFLKVSDIDENIENEIIEKLHKYSRQTVLSKFSHYKQKITDKNEALKFASAKKYFFTLFHKQIKQHTTVNISLKYHTFDLALLLKKNGVQQDFIDLLNLLTQKKSPKTELSC